MATTWGRPSGCSVATDMVWRSWRKASTSSGVILIRSRTFAIGLLRLLQQLGCHRAVGAADGVGRRAHALGTDHGVDEAHGDNLLGRQPGLVVVVHARRQGVRAARAGSVPRPPRPRPGARRDERL